MSDTDFAYTPIANSCGFNTQADGLQSVFDRTCYENKLKNDPKLKTVMDKLAKELVQTFELK